ncbi:unnamed protein product, partial [Ectocarpus sp. 12 AP-2014]
DLTSLRSRLLFGAIFVTAAIGLIGLRRWALTRSVVLLLGQSVSRVSKPFVAHTRPFPAEGRTELFVVRRRRCPADRYPGAAHKRGHGFSGVGRDKRLQLQAFVV